MKIPWEMLTCREVLQEVKVLVPGAQISKRTEPAFLTPCPKVTKVRSIAIELKSSRGTLNSIAIELKLTDNAP